MNTSIINRKNSRGAACRAHTRGFSLLEVMIALAILTISLMAFSTSIGNNVRTSAMAEEMNQAVQLASQRLAEIKINLSEEMARGAFPDEKEEHGIFEKPFEKYRWSYHIRKVEIPVILPTEQAGPESLADDSSGAPPNLLNGGINPMVMQMVAKKISESIRQVDLTISWGEGEEQDREKIMFTTHIAKLR